MRTTSEEKDGMRIPEPSPLHLVAQRPATPLGEEIDMTGIERIEERLDTLADSVNEVSRRLTGLEASMEHLLPQKNACQTHQISLVELRGTVTLLEQRVKTAEEAATGLKKEVSSSQEKIVELEKVRWQLMGAAGAVSVALALLQWALTYFDK
jgi:chromosome segregation ATPase